MDIYISKTNKRKNDLFSNKFELTSELLLNAEIRGNINLITPTFIITPYAQYNNIAEVDKVDYFKYNYVYVPKWERYYFIENISFDGNLTLLYCMEDFLQSWREDLIESTFYCLRSESNFDANIADTFYPTTIDTENISMKLYSPWKDLKNGYYVIGIASGGNDISHIGTNAYYVLDAQNMTYFMEQLMNKAELSLEGLADSIVKTMVNPMQYIRSCYWFPFELDAEMETVDSICFGWWSADGITAQVLEASTIENTYTAFWSEIPASNDFFYNTNIYYLNFPPYTQYRLFAYPFGVIELSTDIISSLYEVSAGSSENSLYMQLIVDHITGMGTLILSIGENSYFDYSGGSPAIAPSDIVDWQNGFTPQLSISPGGYIDTYPHIIVNSQIAVEIPVGEVLQDYASSALSAVKTVGDIASGRGATALADAYSGISAVVPSPTIQGTAGGFAQLLVGENWRINRYTHHTNHSSLEGRVCCHNEKLKELSGFNKFYDVEIFGHMLGEEKDSIKSLLETGIYVRHWS